MLAFRRHLLFTSAAMPIESVLIESGSGLQADCHETGGKTL